jgi:hypothetical protein
MEDEDEDEVAEVAAFKAEVAERLALIEQLSARWAEEEALESEFEQEAHKIKGAWQKSDNGPTDEGYPLSESRHLLSIDDIVIIVRAEAHEISREYFRPFPPRRDDGSLALRSPMYTDRAQGLILDKLRRGILTATGLDFRDPLKRKAITKDSWNALTPIFARSEARTEAFAMLGVRVSVAKRAAKAPDVSKPRSSEAAIREWYKARILGWVAGKPPPSENQDMADLKNGGFHASRQMLRKVRQCFAPHEWLKRGPRGKRANYAEIITPK